MKMFAILQKLVDSKNLETREERRSLQDILLLLERYVDDCHHGKEEQAVFPELLKDLDAETQNLTRELVVDHRNARNLLHEMKAELSSKQTASGGSDSSLAVLATRYINLMRAHIRKENARLLPLCKERFQAETDRRILDQMNAFEQKLFEPQEKEKILARMAELSEKHF